VFDGDPAPLPKENGAEPPNCRPMFIVAKRLDGSRSYLAWRYRPQPRRPCGVRWGPSPRPQKGGRAPSPIFGPFLLWSNGWMHQDATWYGATPQPRGLCVRWGHSPSPKRGRRPRQIFGPCLLCQTAGCITMPLGMQVGLSPGDLVFDGVPAPSPKRGRSPLPIFRPCLLWPNGWMDQDGAWHGGGP